MKRLLPFVFAFAVSLWFPSFVHAASYTVCAAWTVDTEDSGVGEDRFASANSGTLATAKYVQLKVTQSAAGYDSGEKTADSSGCATVTNAPASGTFKVWAWAFLTDPNDTVLRVHNGAWTDFSSFPGSTKVWGVTTTLSSGGQNSILFGGYGAESTMMGMLTYAHLNNMAGMDLSDKTIHVADDCHGASAHYCDDFDCSYDFLAQGRAYLVIPSDDEECEEDDKRRRKFLLGHELGHAEIMLTTQRVEPDVSTMFPVPTGDPCHDTPPGEAANSGYTMESTEWNAVGAREGFAHFFAATAFNNTSETVGYMKWFDTTYNVESNDPAIAGGHFVNNCDNWYNYAGVNEDWLRTYWDYLTPTGSSGVSFSDVRDLYWVVMLNHPSGYTLTKSTYYGGFITALGILGDQPNEDRWVTWGCFNGIDKQPGFTNLDCY